MQHIERLAEISVGRACGMAALGISAIIIGCSPMPLLAARIGAILTSLLLFGLLLKADRAARQDYRRTELWLMLDRSAAPPAHVAQTVIPRVLRDTYLRFADLTAFAALGFWAVGFGFWLSH